MGSQFDFDDWLRLAQENPHAFEARRERLIDETITAAPDRLRDRLRALQWRIDQERRRSGSAFGASLRLQVMLQRQVEKLLLPALEGRLQPPSPTRRSSVAQLPNRLSPVVDS
jgi:hypothetical protein